MNPEEMQRGMIRMPGWGWGGRFLGGGAVWLQPGKINTDLPSGWGRGRSILAGRENTGSRKGRS